MLLDVKEHTWSLQPPRDGIPEQLRPDMWPESHTTPTRSGRLVTAVCAMRDDQRVAVDLRATEPGYAIVGIRGIDLTGPEVRAIPMASLKYRAETMFNLRRCLHGTEAVAERTLGLVGPLWQQHETSTAPPAGGRGRKLDPGRIRAAGIAWHLAGLERRNRKQAVAAALHVSEPQAAVYIRRAREAGILDLPWQPDHDPDREWRRVVEYLAADQGGGRDA